MVIVIIVIIIILFLLFIVYDRFSSQLTDDQTKYIINFNKINDIREVTALDFPRNTQKNIGIRKTGEVFSMLNDSEKQIINIKQTDDKFFDGHMEAGLMGIASHPDFINNSKIYLSYTTKTDRSINGVFMVVNEYFYDGITLVKTKELFSQWYTTDYHHAGTLAFSNSKLYLSSGDGGPQGDPENQAQNPRSFRGKIISIDVNSGAFETVATGLRNPWKITITDRKMLIGDVGYNDLERIYRFNLDSDIMPNYGWPLFEGTLQRDVTSDKKNYVMPVFEYPIGNYTGRATVGGYYMGNLKVYIIGDFLGRMRILREDDGILTEVGSKTFSDKIYSLAYDFNTGKYFILGMNGITELIIT